MTAAARHRRTKFRRPMPEDYRELARTMTDKQLQRHYGAGYGPIARWREESGIPRPIPAAKPNLQMPADFAELARGMTITEAAHRFGRQPETIRRWFVYAGITPRESRVVITKPVSRAALDPSVPGQAAQHLRRFYANVFRADIRLDERTRQTWGTAHGVPDGGRGHHFVSGLGVLPDLEMIALARDHGFREWNA